MDVLLVDDEEHVRETIKLLVNWDLFHKVQLFEAENGQDAKYQIEVNEPDIIITDMKMPMLDGIGLLEWIAKEKRNIPTIVITAFSDYSYMRKALQYGTVDYILKPIDPIELESAIQKAYALLPEEVKESSQLEGMSESIAEIVTYIQENFHQDLKLSDLASRFFLSKGYLSRKFKQELNKSFSDYLVELRIQKAKQLLKETDLKIYEVAENVGFSDDKYFRKVFKRITGETPNDFRS